MTIARKVASMLLETQAVKLSPEKPFKWSSGWNSPIYCDNRVTLSFPEVRTFIKKSLAKVIKKQFPEVEVIAGVATAGIPQGALVAEVLGLPFAYVRPKPKEHGMGNQIEGRIEVGKKVVLIEDLISTGGSSLKAVDALRESGVEVIGMAAIFTYGFKVADVNFEEKGVKLITLSHYSALIEEAIQKNYVSSELLESLKKWRKNPEKWGI
jgi:orotate phosphoribosyltransferase